MKVYPALALIEFDSVPSGLFVSDVMVKESPLSLFKCGAISHGRFLTLIGGSPAAVEIALEEADHAGGGHVADHVYLADIHPALHDAVLGKRQGPAGGGLAIGLLETGRVPGNVRATEIALKGTDCALLEMRLADSVLDGKSVSVFEGALHDIEAALDMAREFLAGKGLEHEAFVLSAPHEATLARLAVSTSFHDVTEIDLSGQPFNPEITHAYR